MNLTSTSFIYFLFVSFTIYWIVPGKIRKYILLASSVIFIGSWGLEDLGIFFISIIIDYLCALKIGREQKCGKSGQRYLVIAILSNLALWFSYKFLGLYHGKSLIIPIGLSFYTFQSLGYTISVFWKRLPPIKNIFDFLLFNAFFSQLAAGPIERAENILPQINSRKELEKKDLKKALFLLGLGFFKKLVVVDRLYLYYMEWSIAPQEFFGFEYLLMIYAGFILIYFDLSSYADIARGIGHLFGYKIISNFDRPYLSTSPRDVWLRWHTSVTSWMRDFLFIPILMKTRSIYIALISTYLIFGIWHAAKVSYLFLGIYWGVIHLLYLELGKYNWIKQLTLPLWGRRVLFFNLIIWSGVFLIEAPVHESIFTFMNLFDFEKPLNISKLLGSDFLLIYAGIIIVMIIEKYEKSILARDGSFVLGYILIFLTVLFRFHESHMFFYFRV